MIYSRLVEVKSSNPSPRGTLVLIPGGPGLSSGSVRSMDTLKRSFDLIYVDPPGSGAVPLAKPMSYTEFVTDVETVLSGINKPVTLVGHSFGGVIAADLTTRSKIKATGLVLIAAPFRLATWATTDELYEKNKSEELKRTTAAWELKKDDNSFRKWVASYGPLYFKSATEAAGREMLLRDQVSANLFIGSGEEGTQKEWLLDACKKVEIPKLFLAGEQDVMIPPHNLKFDAELGGFDFKVISGASHFVMFDQPEMVAKLIEQTF